MLKLAAMREPNVCLLVFAAAVTLFLLIGTVLERTRRSPFLRCFVILLTAVIMMLLGEAGLWFFIGSPQKIPLLKFCAFLSFGCGAAVNALFAYCIVGYLKERGNVSWKYAHFIAAICGILSILVVVSLFNGMLYDFDLNGTYKDGPYIQIVYAVDFGTLLLELLLIVIHRKLLGTKGTLSLLTVGILPLLSMFLLPYWNPTPMYLATTLSLILIKNFFHGELAWQLAEKEVQLTEGHIAIMLSQMPLHFLYNILNSIYYLCESNPMTAQDAVDKVSDYLRNNMKTMEQKEPISFEEEYQHIQTYLSLEKIRFPDSLDIVYDIEVTNFKVPPLTVQPLVENAVKHGVTKKQGGGSVTIATRETKDSYIISVSDTGKGFDTEHYMEDGKEHFGIINVKTRLAHMVRGTLAISSTPDVGTIAVITIPK